MAHYLVQTLWNHGYQAWLTPDKRKIRIDLGTERISLPLKVDNVREFLKSKGI